MRQELLDHDSAAPIAGAGGSTTAAPPRKFRLSGRAAPYVLSLPAFILLCVFVIAPCLLSVVLAMFDWQILKGTGQFVGLDNFKRMLTSEELYRSLRVTIVYAFYTVPVSVGAGLAVALGIHSLRRGGAFWRAVYFVPTAATLAAAAVVWRLLLYPDSGLFDQTVGRLTGTSAWLSSPDLALGAVALVGNWQGIGFAAVIFMAGLAGVPRRLYEAAAIDGAGAWHRFVHVTLPAIGPATVLATMTTTVSSLKAYDQIAIMTAGGPARSTETLTFLIWRRGIDFLDIGGAAVVNLVLLAVAVIATIVLGLFGRAGLASKEK